MRILLVENEPRAAQMPARGRREFVSLGATIAVALGCGCASSGSMPDRATVDAAMRNRISHGIRVAVDEAMPPGTLDEAVPPGVLIEDGLSPEDAVALALWNNPGFQVALTDLGLARADVIEAGQLRNPILSLLFPWGPKQFEATLMLPIEAIWQQPKRVKAASLDADAVAARLMADGLGVMAQARTAYLTATAADARVRLAAESTELWGRLRRIADARLREGDISEFEARSIRSEAAMADAVASGVGGDHEVSRIELDNILGFGVPPSTALTPVDDLRLSPCESIDILITDALASRPDVRAAELAVEAAGARIGLEKSKILAITANLDMNGEGKQGFEMGPGIGLDVPFNGNRGARARAAAGFTQASARYLAVQATVRTEVRSGVARLARAREVLRIWDEQVIESLQIERQQAEKAYEAGETPLYTMLDTARRLVIARQARLDARVNLLTAAIALDRAIGRSCAFR